jgi:FtsH-binding integral membrane protein
MAFAAARTRSIEGAVATLGVSDRIVFLRKTYAHLGGALLAFAAITGGLLKYAPEFSWKFSTLFGTSFFALFGLMIVMCFALFFAQRMTTSSTSRGIQYLGLGLGVLVYAMLFQPLIWLLILKFGYSHDHAIAIREGIVQPVLSGKMIEILTQAIVITLAIFVGLTLVVFLTKKDFSFLRGALVIGSFAAFGFILAGALFGFSLGALFSLFMVLLMAGYILYETSVIMKDFPPTMYVAAAMMLFSTVVTLFWYVLELVMSANRD